MIRTDPKLLARITRALETCEASPSAIETAAELVGGWIDAFEDRDRQEKTLAVEVAFNVKLDPYTYVVGIMDRLSVDMDDPVLIVNEWKTTRPASDYQGPYAWGEKRWLDSITSGIQLPTYALGLTQGKLILKKNARPFTVKGAGGAQSVRVRVRAAVKTSPPQFWPDQGEYARNERGLYEFDQKDIGAARNAYLNAATVIRTLRSANKGKLLGLPWQHTGSQCFHQFGRDCPFLDQCQRHAFPTGTYRVYDPLEDDFDYLAKFGLEGLRRDSRTVILSASSYETWSTCHEKWRVTKGLGVKVEENDLALDTGSAFHRAIAEFYEILKEGK